MRRAAAVLVALAACADLKSAPDANIEGGGGGGGPLDGGSGASPDGGGPNSDGSAPDALGPGGEDAAVGPAEPCEPEVACLDPSDPTVIEVPSEKTMADALTSASAFDTIQVRKIAIDSSVTLPPNVNLHGCEGASIIRSVSVSRGTSTIDGFAVTGSIFVNQNGKFFVKRMKFRPAVVTLAAPLAITSISSETGVEHEVTVSQCSFVGGSKGIDVYANGNVRGMGMTLNVENSVFSRVVAPIVIDRGAETAKVSLYVTSSTFHDFTSAVAFRGFPTPNPMAVLDASLFVKGKTAIDANGTFRDGFSFVHAVVTAMSSPPTPLVAMTDVDPRFVDAAHDDLRLSRGSPAVNRIAGVFVVTPKDFQGCPRPSDIRSDPGAYESQPLP
ncbi:MAG: hypothetical protein U0270_12945 [Labilithrix sp.]